MCKQLDAVYVRALLHVCVLQQVICVRLQAVFWPGAGSSEAALSKVLLNVTTGRLDPELKRLFTALFALTVSRIPACQNAHGRAP